MATEEITLNMAIKARKSLPDKKRPSSSKGKSKSNDPALSARPLP
ncbi:MAG: hypothetical protein VB099_16700 [Candidatus Limiplasma sp.]|nr:hypothetical protein [Candidatus Limiplasma sp.]